MEYEGQICRSPMERSSFMLPVMVGCSYNRCKFCMLFKHLTYRRLPMEQIFADIRRVANLGGDPKWVFLGDGNAFSLPAEGLLPGSFFLSYHCRHQMATENALEAQGAFL